MILLKIYRPTQILSFASTLRSSELSALGLPDFPLDNLYSAIKILVGLCNSVFFSTVKASCNWDMLSAKKKWPNFQFQWRGAFSIVLCMNGQLTENPGEAANTINEDEKL